MMVLRTCLALFQAFASGVVIAGGIFSFMAMIGIVPRLAQRSNTKNLTMIYEDAIMLGGVVGALKMFVDIKIFVGLFGAIVLTFTNGIFVGVLAVSLAEVLNVIPIFVRRAKITKGITAMIVALALGKFFGSIVDFFI